MTSKEFKSPTWGEVNLNQVLTIISEFVHQDKSFQYRIIIGTDSCANGDKPADFVTALVVLRVGAGGIYFWQRSTKPKFPAMRPRIYEEALASLRLAEEVILAVGNRKELLEHGVEIHVDIGRKGATREMISEIVAIVQANGFDAKIKPDSFGATKIAHRYV